MERQAKDGTIYQQVGKDEWTPVTRTAKDGTIYKKMGADEWAPLDVSSAKPEGDKSPSKIGELANRFVDDIARPVKALGTAIDYLDAPIRQAAAIPGKIAHGEGVLKPILDVPAQLFKGPSTAPTWEQVYSKSGVPDKPVRMSNVENAHPELGVLPDAMFDEGDKVNTPSAAARLGLATELGAGGMGLRAILKTPALAKAGLSAVNNQLIKRFGDGLQYSEVENAPKILEAAKRLGIKEVPKAVLVDNKMYQDLESGLSQSGSLPARKINAQYEEFFKGLKDAGKKIKEMRSTDSDVGIGQDIQSTLVNDVKAKKAPVSELYESFNPDLTKIDVNKDVVKRVFADLKRHPLFQTNEGKALLNEYQQGTGEQSNLASLKEWRQTVRGAAESGASPNQKARLDKIAEAVTKVRNNTIEATKAELPKSLHGEVDNFLNQIALADAAHASNIKEVNAVSALAGNKEFKSPGEFVAHVNSMTGEQIAKKAANLDVASMEHLKDKFPQVYEKVKTARINDMIDRAGGENLKDHAFLKIYDGLDAEMKNLLFTPEQQSQLADYKLLKSSIPEKLGPSGTPKGKMMMEMGSPKRTYKDYVTRKAIESVDPAKKASETPSKLENIIPMTRVQGAAQAVPQVVKDSNVLNFPRAADNKELKGRDKWADDGLKKLIEHADDQFLKSKLNGERESLLSDPKLKDLLIKASDLKPGTKPMNDLMKQIKERVAKENN